METVTIETKLDKDFLKRDEVKEFLGKNVEIVIRKKDSKEYHRERLAESGGRQDFGGKFDNLSLREWLYG